MKLFLTFFGIFLAASSFAQKGIDKKFIPIPFSLEAAPAAPDYSRDDHWAALPKRKDGADQVPEGFTDGQASAEVDVFFIHPTTFMRRDSAWNAALDDVSINENTDERVLPNQASAFNASGRIYAPRYRQAHLKSYWNLKEGGRQAIQLAYKDVRAAFMYYMEHYNEGRPFILASHSQGSTHAIWLTEEFIDEKPLQEQLIAAYLVGMPVPPDTFETLKPCSTAGECGCFQSWNTYGNHHKPKNYWFYQGSVVTNPITWTLEDGFSPREAHKGILYYDYRLKYQQTLQVGIHDGLLWMKRPKVWFRYFLKNRSWHPADYNLFWLNVRENVTLQVSNYLKQKKAEEGSQP